MNQQQRTSNIQEVVKNKAKINATPFHIDNNGNGYYEYQGKKWSAKLFEAMFPTKLVVQNAKGENPDGTKIK